MVGSILAGINMLTNLTDFLTDFLVMVVLTMAIPLSPTEAVMPTMLIHQPSMELLDNI